MGPESLNPLDELKTLDRQVDQATDLAALKPIFFRVDQIAREYSGDLDIQLMAGDVKQHAVKQGTSLRDHAPVSVDPPLEAVPPLETAPPAPVADGDQISMFEPAPAPAAPPPTQRKKPPRPPLNWKRALLLGVLAGSFVSIAFIALLVNQARRSNLVNEPTVRVDITTTPGGAAVRVSSSSQPSPASLATPASAAEASGEYKCTSDCRLSLRAGEYQVTAFLDGYEASTSSIRVTNGQPVSVNLTLEPQALTLRILTDLEQGKIAFDDRPPADLQEGQFIVDKVTPGAHTVKLTGPNSDASFSFNVPGAQPPAIEGVPATHNLIAVLVASMGNKARLVASSGPLKLALNGQPQADAGPGGVDLKEFQPGVDEIVIGEGKDQRNMKESFGPAPMLTAFLKSDVNSGTLIVSTGEDDVRVFLNNKEYRRRTQRGQLRIPAMGAVSVRVAKDGFEAAPQQSAEVKKGAEVRLEFKLKALPKVATLQIRGATAGAEVLVDQKSVGTVGGDGSFTYPAIAPGDRSIELRHDQFLPKRLQRNFKAGQTVALSGADVVLASAGAVIRLARTPAGASVSYRRADETEAHEARGNQFELPAGNYVFLAKAPGYADQTERVQVAAGETRSLEFTLARERIPAPVAAPVGGIADFEDASAWKKDGELWVHRGAGFIPYKLPSKGVFTFTVELLKGGNVFRGGRIRWCVQYLDARNYLLFELDRKNFWAEVMEKGKKYERAKTQHDLEKQKAFTVQIDASAERLVHKINNGSEWIVLDSFAEPGRDFTQGKFGFLIQGNDEIGLADFKFTPK